MTHSDSTSTVSKQGNRSKDQSQSHIDGEEQTSEFPEAEINVLLDQVQDWVKENQTLAMLGGFGLGVFIGVLLRR